MPDQVRVPPHSLDAERAVLGSVFIKPSVMALLVAELQVDDFFQPQHREVFDAMLTVDKRGFPLDVIAVADELKARDVMKRLEGGEGYLLSLMGAVPTAENVDYYLGVVRERSQLRRIIAVASETASRAYGPDARADELLEDSSAAMLKIASASGSELVVAGELVDEALEEFERRQLRAKEGQSVITGIRTGITKLDIVTSGFQKHQVITIGGETGGGKTALAMQVATLLSQDEDGLAIAFNLEMPRVELVERTFVSLAEVDSQKLKNGFIDHQDFKRLHGAGNQIRERALFIEDKVFTLREMEARCRRLRAKYPKKKRVLGIVDTVQLMGHAGPKENRAREIGMITKGVKQLAKKLDMTWIVVSQINRDAAKAKKDKQGNPIPPSLHDLKESGDIEQDSDIIILTHNPDELDDADVDLYMVKHRNGARKKVRAHWTAKFYRFSDPEIDMGPAPQDDRRYAG